MATDIADLVTAGRLSRPADGWLDFLRHFFRLAGAYWNGANKWRVRGLTLLLVVLTIGQVALAVALNSWIEALFDTLEQRALDRFLTLSGLLGLIVAVNAGVVTLHLRIKRRIQIDWRGWLTSQVVDDWMAAGHHYQVTHTPGDHDNPDGRIAEDVRIATEFAIDLGHSLFYSAILLISFTQILWVLSENLYVRVGDLDAHIPGHMVWIALLYSVVGTSVALVLGWPLIRAANHRQTGEANFRYGLVHGRQHSLAIALLRGEAEERRRFRGLFGGAAFAWDRQTAALSYMFLFTASWSVLSQVFPVLVAAPDYIVGAVTLGGLMQTAQAFQQMTAALSWPIDNLARVAEWRASVERVQGLYEALGRLRDLTPAGEKRGLVAAPGDRQVLAFNNVSVATPGGETFIRAFDQEIRPRDRVLVSGDATAIGALVKAMAGLWPWGDGRIELPPGARLFVMSPRTYMPVGPLRDALCYPAPPGSFEESQIDTALSQVDLSHLIPRLNKIEHWETTLTVDEQQRIGFARLLLHRPDWICIHEATEPLDARGEEDMMRLLEAELPDAAIMTIGRSPVLMAFHQRKWSIRRTNGAAVLREGVIKPARRPLAT